MSNDPGAREGISGERRKRSRGVPLDLEVTLEAGGRRAQVGRVVNLSPTGLFATAPNLFPVGSVLRISLLVPQGAGSFLLNAWGRVRWVNDPSAPQAPRLPNGMGMEFIDLDPRAAAGIEAFLDERRARPVARPRRSGRQSSRSTPTSG